MSASIGAAARVAKLSSSRHLLLLLCCRLSYAAAQESTASGSNNGMYDPVSYLKQVTAPKASVADIWAAHKPAANHDAIVAVAPDTWQVLPKALDKKVRNPCWTDETTQRFRCMPYFQIIGVSKCGTTDLYNRLRRHPDLADGSKGPHFWDECVYPPKGACTAPPNGDFDGYVNLFEKGAYQIQKNPEAICGEASSNTYTGVYTYARGLTRTKNTNVTLAELIHEAQPYTRLVVIMREPISRFYSAFHYYRRSSKEPFEGPEKFHARAVSEMRRWKECEDKLGRVECLRRYDPQQLIKGMYGEFVEAWTSKFPADQIMWIRTEDYKAAPQEHLVAVFRHLGLRNLTEIEWDSMMRMRRSNTQSARYPRMNADTRTLLQEFYAPFNAKLAKVLKDERYTWADKQVAVGQEGGSGVAALGQGAGAAGNSFSAKVSRLP